MLTITAIKYRENRAVVAVASSMVVVAVIFTTFDVHHNENYYDTRDALVRVKLLASEVDMVGLEKWDQSRVIVKKDGCTASYDIQPDNQLNQPDSWPLVPATGRPISGSCNGPQLDELFAPAP